MPNDILSVLIPQNLENIQLPSPELLNYYKDLEERKFWIDFDIDPGLIEVSKYILRWNKEDVGKPEKDIVPIRLYIFSNGGDADSTFNLVNICALSKTPIYTYNMGVAMSAGLIILLAGHKRFCLEGSRAMIHSGSGGISGTAEQIDSAASDYRKFVSYMRDYVVSRTKPKLNIKLLNKNKDKDWYLYAKDQVEQGIVDSIITDINEIL